MNQTRKNLLDCHRCIDLDFADFYRVLKIVQYAIPCRIRRSSSKEGFHIVTDSEYADFLAENVDDENRIWLRQEGYPVIALFRKKRSRQKFKRLSGKWFNILDLNDFLRRFI